MKKVKQFDIWNVNLYPAKGSEQKGVRPSLILQTNAANKVARTFVVAPLTTKKFDKIYPYEFILKKDSSNKLKYDSKVLFNQIRTVDEIGFIKKIGVLNDNDYKKVFDSMDVIFDREGLFR